MSGTSMESTARGAAAARGIARAVGACVVWVAAVGMIGAGCDDDVNARLDSDIGDAEPEPDIGPETDMRLPDMGDCGDAEPEICTVGIGACKREGPEECVGETYQCTIEAGQPEVDGCNAVDDDCDGMIDEADDEGMVDCYTGPPRTAGVGQCLAGTQSCVDGEAGPCVGEVLPAEEICNGIDDDCDGEVDKDAPMLPCYTGPEGTEGIGACVGGTRICNEGEYGACEGDTVPTDEICDGIDQDCDASVDEGTGSDCYSGPAGTQGVGECRSGYRACVDGAPGACEDEVLPTAELCNGLDDDCDGAIDEEIAPRPCYTGPAGTEGVGQCVGGTQACEAGRFDEVCADEVTPQAEVCDGVDRDCDGLVDIGGDPAAPGPARAVCGELVASRCRLWLAWTDEAGQLDPGEDLGRSFTEWADCPDDGEDQTGRARCTQTGYDRIFHTLELPARELVARSDRIGIRWQCQGDGQAPAALVPQLREIEERCRVTLGERYDVPGPSVAADWAPCDAQQQALYGVEGASRCSTTVRNIVQGPRWRAVSFGRILGDGTDLGIALRCDDDPVDAPYLASIERQAELWIGWGARPGGARAPGSPADGISPEPWTVCDGTDAVEEGPVRCGPSDCRGWFRRISVPIDRSQPESYDPGLLGAALRVRPVDALQAPACAEEAGR